jgi:methylglutaconyl-CoA hydratase
MTIPAQTQSNPQQQSNLVLSERANSYTQVLTLNRPEKRNALSVALMQQLCSAYETAQQDPAIRAVILRGAGDVFCAGLDLQEANQAGKTDSSAHAVARTLLTLHNTPMVTIAAVHGAAMAGGAGLMSACDFAILAQGTKVGYPEVRRGMIAALVYTFLARQLNTRAIRELLLLAEPISAERAQQIGLINRVVPQGRLMDEAMRIAATVVQGGPQAVGETKRLIRDFRPPTVTDDIQRAIEFHLAMRTSDEAAEGIAAFLEKRKPKWVPPQ